MSGDMERAIGDLMTDVTEERVDGRRRTRRYEERRDDDCPDPHQHDARGYHPDADRLRSITPLQAVRDIVLCGLGHISDITKLVITTLVITRRQHHLDLLRVIANAVITNLVMISDNGLLIL